jgi:glycosyltransferase involved in cell wall biosynthesis
LGCIYLKLNFQTKTTNPFRDLFLIFQLYRHYRTIKPLIIFHYTIKPNIYGTIAAKLAGIKSIGIVTGLGYAFLTTNLVTRLIRRLYKFSFRFSFKVWFLNQDDMGLFIHEKLIQPQKAFLLPGEGVNTDEFSPISVSRTEHDIIFLMIARILWDKGVQEYVDAAKIIKSRYPNARFQLLGPTDADNPSAVPRSTVEEWHRQGSIEYLGISGHVVAEIAKADCIVLPSYREGISKVLMEAASMAKPLIASNVTGCKELIDDSITGYLCEVKSSSSLAEKIEKMLQATTEERIEMGNKGRDKMIHYFDEKKIIQFYLDTIKINL